MAVQLRHASNVSEVALSGATSFRLFTDSDLLQYRPSGTGDWITATDGLILSEGNYEFRSAFGARASIREVTCSGTEGTLAYMIPSSPTLLDVLSNTSTRFTATMAQEPKPARVVTELSADRATGRFQDASGPIHLQGGNWHGPESSAGVLVGLETLPLTNLIGILRDLRMQVIRVPFSADILNKTGTNLNVNYTANPELTGMTRIEALDYCITQMGKFGIAVILDMHRKTAGVGVDDDGVWYDGSFTETDFITAWEALATRYAGFQNVIGFDPWNEPHKAAHWGNSGDTADDWKRVSETVCNAVHAIAPHWMAFIEGVQNSEWDGGDTHWLGGNFQDAKDPAIGHAVLNLPNKLAYAPHEYQPALIQPRWDVYKRLETEADFQTFFYENWGFAEEDGIPIAIGETGDNFFDPLSFVHMDALIDLVNRQSIMVLYWSIFPPSNDSGSIVEEDYYIRNEDNLHRKYIVRDALLRNNATFPTEDAVRRVHLSLSPAQDFEFNSYFELAVAADSPIPAADVDIPSSRFGTTRNSTTGTEQWHVPINVRSTGTLRLEVRFTSGSVDGVIEMEIN